ncbi:autophagy-related protein 2 isoform X2 [Momordica charantia]|uniref:Autophagy-related protein 2 n=1 Tax=Momordica charantia TaxID=3673 RepID=A0A6J1D7J3_MOMCH|nr:autophagy-related protein 2 isoform X2 [Momordica charantia]
MFPWNIAKTAEAMFSKFAVKRLCKFLLKKKLGQFLLGDIDLDQLDVQLAEGTIQLGDLALNVDFLNEKVGTAASVIFKEGSIGSLLIRMPWTSRGCEVEINELELVLSPCLKNDHMDCCGTSSGGHRNHHESRKPEHDVVKNAVKSTYGDIHEGVKTVAKMVKGLLASFHLKITNLIVAFDSFYEENKNRTGPDTTLVLRISDIECGTCVTEDGKLGVDAVESFLGISQLNNFVKFQGAMLEFLHMDDCDNPKSFSCMSGTTSAQMVLDPVPSNVSTPVLTGEIGGFSGNLKLCIPLRDGSLDIHRVDGDLFVDPVQVKLQPSTIKCLLLLSEAYWNSNKNGDGCIHDKLNESGYFERAPHCHSSLLASAETTPDEMFPRCGGILPGSHLISNWVSSSVKHKEKEKVGEEFDFGASVDQFFECLNEIRSSHYALGSSGMWNSVFSAITAASSLASGSLHVPCDTELQHVETNLRATISGVSIVLSFLDDNQYHFTDPKKVQINADSAVHFVAAKFSDVHLLMQVSTQKTMFHGTVKHIEVADYLNFKNDASNTDFHNSGSDFQTLLTKRLQVDVVGALPPFGFSVENPDLMESNSSFSVDFPCGNKDNVTKVTLLETYGITSSQLDVIPSSSDNSTTMSKSFSLNLPPLVFWVNYPLVNMLLDLLKGVENCMPGDNQCKVFNENYIVGHEDVKSGSNQVTTLFSSASMEGNIIISNARVIFCFSFESDKDFMGYSTWDQFIALDFYSSSIVKEETMTHSGNLALQKNYLSEKNALHFRFGSLEVFLVTFDEGITQSSTCNMQKKKFSAHNILSAFNRTNSSSLTLFWQEGHVTGPWIAKKAKSLASLEESKSRCKFIGKDYEFASVSSMKDMEESNLQTRQEMILSSTSVLHVFFSLVRINVNTVQYKVFHCLLDQLIKGLSSNTCDAVNVKKGLLTSQTSIVVDCNCLEIAIRPDSKESTKCSLQRELPGSWYHLRLEIQNFELISVSNLGGIKGANFFWLAHGEGKLLGFISEDPNQEFLLISCSNSNMKRGDGEGSNALSSRLAGCDIVHMWDPESCQGFSSITIRCATILAIGGRLDWLDVICSFFFLSPPVEPEGDKVMPRQNPKKSSGSYFSLNFIDVGLSYQPYLKNLLVNSEPPQTESSFSTIKQELDEGYVACLLAASSVTLSSSSVADVVEDNYRITIQDVGLLLCSVSDYEHVLNAYNVEDLRKAGYVKVARDTFIEAILRTNCNDGLKWELECPKAHIVVETCHDTTTGLVRLAAQLQQLFAPDLEESIVHLQTRWNNVQQAQERKEIDNESSSPPCHNPPVKKSEVGLMDEICEDAFLLDKDNQTREWYFSKSNHSLPNEGLHAEVCSLNCEVHETSSPAYPFIGSEPDGQTSFMQYCQFPEIIEGYCLSELRPLSDLTIGRQLPSDICNSRNSGGIDLGGRRSGWYGGVPIQILENHISDASKIEDSVRDDLCSIESKRFDEVEEASGRVLLSNIDVRWRMYAGSDWQVSRENGDRRMSMFKRDQHTCLELACSAMQVQYDIFPVGEMCVSRLSLSVQDFHLHDRSVDAPWKLVLGYYNSKNHPRKSSSKALKLDLEAIRPDPSIPLEEYRLRIGFLPMLLHLHQCQLDFLVNFFGEKSSSGDQSSCHPLDSDGSKTISTTKSPAGLTFAEEALLPYFQKFDIQPIVVRVDYSPSRVDLAALRGGKYVELVNLVPWKGVELHLKHVQAVGVYGWGCVGETVIGEWLEDISHNQIRKILEGLPTVRSLVAVGSGASKLVSFPVESYKKDRRLLKGMQRGTIAFLRSISLEAVGLGVHLAAGAHDILLQAEYMLTSIPPSVKVRYKTKANIRSNQPKDAQEGLKKAYESISDGLGKSASALVRTPLKKYQRGGSTVSAFATAVQAIPAAAIAPASACASAIHYTFLGLRNSLDPERKRESMEKYLGPTDSWERN